jgi:hypothetical protein
MYKHSHHSRFTPEGVAEAPKVLLRDTPVFQNHLAMRKTTDVTNGKPIAVWSQSISNVNAVGPLVAFYDISRKKGKVLFHTSVLNTTWDQVSR